MIQSKCDSTWFYNGWWRRRTYCAHAYLFHDVFGTWPVVAHTMSMSYIQQHSNSHNYCVSTRYNKHYTNRHIQSLCPEWYLKNYTYVNSVTINLVHTMELSTRIVSISYQYRFYALYTKNSAYTELFASRMTVRVRVWLPPQIEQFDDHTDHADSRHTRAAQAKRCISAHDSRIGISIHRTTSQTEAPTITYVNDPYSTLPVPSRMGLFDRQGILPCHRH